MGDASSRGHGPRRNRALPLVAVAIGALVFSSAGGPSAPAYAGKAMDAVADGRVELGRRLFFDPAVSRSGRVSCGSCHDPAHGFADPRRLSDDDDLSTTRRHASTLVDCQPSPAMHWDGEFATIQSLVIARLGSAREFQREASRPRKDLGDKPIDSRLRSRYGIRARRNNASVAEHVARLGRYDESVRAVYRDGALTTARIAEAIDAYVQTIRSTPGAYDRFAGGDTGAMSASARRGLALFEGRAGCAQCHLTSGSHPTFTDYAFHDTGVSFRAAKAAEQLAQQSARTGRRRRLRELPTDPRKLAREVMRGRIQAQVDGGRAEVSGDAEDVLRFKTPSLRDVALRPPYMHDGSFASLHEVVRYYAAGGTRDDRALDHRIRPFEASERDVADLVAFLETLTGDERPGRAPAAWGARAHRVRIGFVDAAGRPLVGLPVTLRGIGDEVPGATRATARQRLRTDAQGWVEFRPPHATHVRLSLPGDLRLPGGNRLPDTCRDARIGVPVAGRASFALRLPDGVAAPAELALACASGSLTANLDAVTGETAVYGVWLRDGQAGAGASLSCADELGLDVPGRVRVPLRDRGCATVDLRR